MSAATQDAVQRQLTAARTSLQQLTTAKETFEELTEQLQTAQTRVESCERDLKNALGDTTKQQLLKEHGELVRQNRQLAQYLALVQRAEGYFEEFSPEECPVCDTGVGPADVLSGLQDRVASDRRAAALDDALKRLQARLGAIDVAEAALAAARTTCASFGSKTAAARIQLEKLLEDPADLSSVDRTVGHLAERVRQLELELELSESGSLVAIKRNTLNRLRAEARFQGYRSREERLNRKLASGLEPVREAHREFADVLETLRAIREALQASFNSTLNGKLPQINALMTEVYGRLTQQASFPKIVVESGPPEATRTLRVGVTSDRTPGKSFEPAEVLNGQTFNAVNLVPYFVFSQFQAEALELDCLLIDDPSQSFDTSRVELLIRELATAATHAQLIVASHEEDRSILRRLRAQVGDIEFGYRAQGLFAHVLRRIGKRSEKSRRATGVPLDGPDPDRGDDAGQARASTGIAGGTRCGVRRGGTTRAGLDRRCANGGAAPRSGAAHLVELRAAVLGLE